MTTVDECVMSITVCLLLFSKRLLFTFCDYRTPTLLSVLILTLSGRYSNECSPLDPSVNSARATYIQNSCFSVQIINLSWVGLQYHHIHISEVMRPCFSSMYSHSTRCCFWYSPLCFLWVCLVSLPLVDVFSLCALEQKQIAIVYQRSSISYTTEINVKQRKWLNNVVCVCRCVIHTLLFARSTPVCVFRMVYSAVS